MNKLDECIEDTLTRLEELESGIKMVSLLKTYPEQLALVCCRVWNNFKINFWFLIDSISN